MTSTDLVPARSRAALKAWETRRAQGWTSKGRGERSDPRSPSAVEAAIAAFDREADAYMPDWHRAAIALKAALELRTGTRKAPRTLQLVEHWPDYDVERATLRIMQWPSPILVVTFADGEVVRAPAVSVIDKPVNVGRGLRIAIAFYTARRARRTGLKNLPGTRPAVPEIASCVCEDTGEVYDPAKCSEKTTGYRAAQDWKIRNRSKEEY